MSRTAWITLSLNLEMSRNFPTVDQTHWDYEKGNLDTQNKRYAVDVGRFLAAHGAKMTYCVVGQVLEHPDVGWLEEIHRAGHPLANHTYDHVLLKADTPEKLQFKFQRAPWLVRGKTVAQVVEENIRLTNAALRQRLGLSRVRGFRSSEEYATGLRELPAQQEMLHRLGFEWVGTHYAPIRVPANARPTPALFSEIRASQAKTQPYRYPNGLVEIPKASVGDIAAFRTGRWELSDYLESVRVGLEWAIENRATYCLAAHSSVLAVRDPSFEVFKLVLDSVARARDQAELLMMDEIAARVRSAP